MIEENSKIEHKEQALHIAELQALLIIRRKLLSIQSDIDNLIKLLAKEYGLDLVLEPKPQYIE
jgi:hypothetical protein